MNSELLRVLFKTSLERLNLSLLQAKDWINSRLGEEGYSYEQLYRFGQTGLNKAHARKTIDKEMLRALARAEFWWDEKRGRPYSEQEIEELICGQEDYNKPQLSLLELEEVGKLKTRIERLSPAGIATLLADKNIQKATTGRPVSDRALRTTEIQDFYRLRNWLISSLEKIGLPGQPRTAAQLRGYKGRIGENLNLLFEGQRGISLNREDYVAASFILCRIKGWNGVQPIFTDYPTSYDGDWQKMLLDLRRNGQSAPL